MFVPTQLNQLYRMAFGSSHKINIMSALPGMPTNVVCTLTTRIILISYVTVDPSEEFSLLSVFSTVLEQVSTNRH